MKPSGWRRWEVGVSWIAGAAAGRVAKV